MIFLKISGAWVDVSGSVTGANINIAQDAFCFECSVSFIGLDYYNYCNPLVDYDELRVKVVIDSEEYLFLIEERDLTHKPCGLTFDIWGRSAHAYLGEKFSKSISDTSGFQPVCGHGFEDLCNEFSCAKAGGTWDATTETCLFDSGDPIQTPHPWMNADCLVSDIVDSFSDYCSYPFIIDWNVEDFMVHKGTLVVENKFPIQILKELAKTIGADVICKPDGSLSVEEFSTDLDTADFDLNDEDHIIELSSRIEATKGHNAIIIYGYKDIEDGEEVTPKAYLNLSAAETPYLIDTDYDFKLYFFNSKVDAEINDYIDGLTVTRGTPGTETITETVTLKWGKGNTSFANADGETLVAGDDSIFLTETEVTYSVNVLPLTVSASAAGKFPLFYYYDEGTEAGAEVEFLETIGNAQPAFLTGAKTSDGGIETGEAFSLRLYYFHPTALSTLILTDTYDGDDVNSTYITSGQETITEEINLKYGSGNRSLPDLDGIKSVYDASQADNPLSKKTVTYSTRYKDYDLFTDTAGQHTLLFYFEDKSASYMFNFSAVDPTIPPEPEYTTPTIRIKNYITKAVVSGATIYIDGENKGVTDSEGELTLPAMEIGTTHDIKIIRSGYKDSDQDRLENDTFTVAG